MKKQVWVTIAMVLVLMLGCVAAVQAELYPPHGEGQIGLDAVVLCEKLTVRKEPSASSKAVDSLEYGRTVAVYEQSNGWAKIFVSDDVDAEPAGWVNAEYLAIDPAWYRTDGKTAVYAWNSTSAPKVALLDDDTVLPVLRQEGDWIIVSLRGAVGFIRL